MHACKRGSVLLLCLALLLLGMPARASTGSVILKSGQTIEARLAGIIWTGGQEFFVFEEPDGSLIRLARDDIAAIAFAPVATDYTAQAPTPGTPVPPPPPPVYATEEVETNNEQGSATLVALNTDITGRIQTAGDIDFYKVSVSKHGHFAVLCTQPIDLYIELVDAQGKVLGGGDFGGSGTATDLKVDVFTPGDYYVKIRAYSASAASPTHYTLRVGFKEGMMEAWEPNDTLETASPLPAGGSFDAWISSPHDRDYYYIDVTRPATVKVTSTQPQDYHLEILDRDGTTVLAGGDLGSKGTLMIATADLLGSGRYYVLMRPYSKAYDMDTPYQMTVEVTVGHSDPWEPNDTPEHAHRAVFGQEFAAYISDPDDRDYYRVDVSGPTSISVQSDQPEDYYLAILAPDGKAQLAGGDMGGKGSRMSAAVDVFLPGTYYVLMRPYSRAYNIHQPYNMRIDVTPGGVDPNEPNDSSAQARPVAIGEKVSGYISSPEDCDYFVFDLRADSPVRVTCTQPGDFLIELQDASGKVISGGDFGGKGTMMQISTHLRPGRYYILLKPYNRSGFNMHAAYELVVSQ
ncbi:MAG: hypothetical protein NUW23_09210 [Firmicutes bacterium]|nr:hypothetical protein [Bacillota bacterium]